MRPSWGKDKVESSLASNQWLQNISLCRLFCFSFPFSVIFYISWIQYNCHIYIPFNELITVLSQTLVFNETWKIFIAQPCMNCFYITTWNLQRNPYLASIYFLPLAIEYKRLKDYASSEVFARKTADSVICHSGLQQRECFKCNSTQPHHRSPGLVARGCKTQRLVQRFIFLL